MSVTMKVDFDNLRRNAVRSYNGLVKELNECVGPFGEINQLNVSDIREHVDRLRSSIAILVCLMDESGKYKALEDVDLLVFAAAEEDE